MKYILVLALGLFPSISFANEQSEKQLKEQSILKYCLKNPDHEPCKLFEQIFDEIKPRSTISKFLRFVSGKSTFLLGNFMRPHFLILCEEIGKKNNWDQEKTYQEIYQEFDKLCAEADRNSK